ncbi:hypothetical protein QVD17_02302 [Tagetes erecta]|uniref:Uncharacterized protein n=1 Tax=Tagetes erecta TaxID=13708 RepID=A0AAD8LC64_TARER|nr:hypothetical protein QVD17_02302 [Tagetes erecta]
MMWHDIHKAVAVCEWWLYVVVFPIIFKDYVFLYHSRTLLGLSLSNTVFNTHTLDPSPFSYSQIYCLIDPPNQSVLEFRSFHIRSKVGNGKR